MAGGRACHFGFAGLRLDDLGRVDRMDRVLSAAQQDPGASVEVGIGEVAPVVGPRGGGGLVLDGRLPEAGEPETTVPGG